MKIHWILLIKKIFSVICLFEEYACMYSCQDTVELRIDELRRSLNGEPLRPCPTSRILEKTVDHEINSSIGKMKNYIPILPYHCQSFEKISFQKF